MNENAFSNIIGYESVVRELMQYADMLQNPAPYDAVGARLPRGLLLSGPKGVGKTQLAQCLCRQAGVPTTLLRKDTTNMTAKITEAFRKAAEIPGTSIILFDDMDKYSAGKGNCDEFVSLQTGIDETADKNVFVIATANDTDLLPSSLLRPGRFDRHIEVGLPTHDDTVKLVRHFLGQTAARKELDAEDIGNALTSASCAELEALFNDAAIAAAFERRALVNRTDVKNAILRRHYNAPNDIPVSQQELRISAVHEAGHMVIAETLYPGSVGLASVRSSGRERLGGFIHVCTDEFGPEDRILVSLAGAAAVERVFGDSGTGCEVDLKKAAADLMTLCQSGIYGLEQFDPSEAVTQKYFFEPLDPKRSSASVHALLNVYQRKVRQMLAEHDGFLRRTADLLEREQTLFRSEIRNLRENNA